MKQAILNVYENLSEDKRIELTTYLSQRNMTLDDFADSCEIVINWVADIIPKIVDILLDIIKENPEIAQKYMQDGTYQADYNEVFGEGE